MKIIVDTFSRYLLQRPSTECSPIPVPPQTCNGHTHIGVPDVCFKHLILLVNIHNLYKTQPELDGDHVRGVGHWSANCGVVLVLLEQTLDQRFLLRYGLVQRPVYGTIVLNS